MTFSVNIKNARLRDLRKAHVTTTLLLDIREPRSLNTVELPAHVTENIERTRKRLLGAEVLRKKEDEIILGTADHTRSASNMISMLKDHQIQHYESSTKVRTMHSDIESFADRLDADQLEDFTTRMENKIKNLTDSINLKYEKKKAKMDAQGVFHSAANACRVQAMCAAEIQQALKLENLRLEVLREMLNELNPDDTLSVVDDEEEDEQTRLGDILNSKLKEKENERMLQQVKASVTSKTSMIRKRTRQISLMKAVNGATQFSTPLVENSVSNTARSAVAPAEVSVMNEHPHIAAIVTRLRRAGKRRRGEDLKLETKEQESFRAWKERGYLSKDIARNSIIELKNAAEVAFISSGTDFLEHLHAPKTTTTLKKSNTKNANGTTTDPASIMYDDLDEFESADARFERVQKNYQLAKESIAKRVPKRVDNEPKATETDDESQEEEEEDQVVPLSTIHKAGLLNQDSEEESSSPSPSNGNVSPPSNRRRTSSAIPPAIIRSSSTIGTITPKSRAKVGVPENVTVASLQTTKRASLRRETIKGRKGSRWEWGSNNIESALFAADNNALATIPNSDDEDDFSEEYNENVPVTKEEPTTEYHSVVEKGGKTVYDSFGNAITMGGIQQQIKLIFSLLEIPYGEQLRMLANYTATVNTQDILNSIQVWLKAARCIAIEQKMLRCQCEIQDGCMYLSSNVVLQEDEIGFLKANLLNDLQLYLPIPAFQEDDITITKNWLAKTIPAVTSACRTAARDVMEQTGEQITFNGKYYDYYE